MKFVKKNEDEEMWGIYWEDLGKENFLCMTDHKVKADIIINSLTFVTTRSPLIGGMLENVRDPG